MIRDGSSSKNEKNTLSFNIEKKDRKNSSISENDNEITA